MKKFIINIVFLAIAFTAACNEPSPTQLFVDNNSSADELDIEILSPDPESVNYANGYDSTGITNDLPKFANVISLNGIKSTFKNNTFYQVYNSAIFGTKTEPVHSQRGHFMGYRSWNIGKVFFNNQRASLIQRVVQFRNHGNIIDSLFGPMYIQTERKGMGHGYSDFFPYNSSINVRIEPHPFLGYENISFEVKTPEEINGTVAFKGRRDRKDLKMELMWNALTRGKIDIIVGGYSKEQNVVVPLLRIRVKDDGKVNLPPSVMNSIPLDRFDDLLITFQRKYSKEFTSSSLSDNIVISNSIHNIRLDVP
ncbi:MAG: hypothetical protein KKD86_11550 [Bacteroidetes bacterium]|nr:hypothetical protein [Bacteroidota bacterium]